MFSSRSSATVWMAVVVLLLTACAPSRNATACRAFEGAFAEWDFAMEESAPDDEASIRMAVELMRDGLERASSSADGDVARALAFARAALVLWDFRRRPGTDTGEFRQDFRVHGESVAAACYAAGTSIRLD